MITQSVLTDEKIQPSIRNLRRRGYSSVDRWRGCDIKLQFLKSGRRRMRLGDVVKLPEIQCRGYNVCASGLKCGAQCISQAAL